VRALFSCFVICLFAQQAAATQAIQSASQKANLVLQHRASVTNLAWSPDGNYLATSGILSPDVTVWDIRTGQRVRQLPTLALFGGGPLSYAAGGHLLLAPIAEDKLNVAFSVWDTRSWTLIGHVRGKIPEKPARWNAAKAFSASGASDRFAYAILEERGGPVEILDQNTWSSARSIAVEDMLPSSTAVAPDGKSLAIGNPGGKIAILDVESGALIRRIDAYPKPELAVGISHLAFSPDGQLLATGPTGTLVSKAPPADPVRIWQINDGKLHSSIEGKFGSLYGMAWSPDGESLAFSASDKTVYVWHLQTGLAKVASFPQQPFAVGFSPDGKRLGIVAGTVAVILKAK
jgi:WD40 repeat protein